MELFGYLGIIHLLVITLKRFFMKRSLLLTLALSLSTFPLFAAKSPKSIDKALKSKESISLDKLKESRQSLWKLYKNKSSKDKKRLLEHSSKKITFAKHTMRYDYTKIGKVPKAGYPLYIALHGGGSGPNDWVNDSQWNHMKVYYAKAVKSGVYLAARGINNTWNLHSRNESYPMYDRLIENMILFENVDPNRVYILGFSAGGDGTYQIAPRMADRFAAANMSAGHHNGISPRNLYNLPFLLQVGEYDKAYKRHQETVKFSQKLDAFQAQEKKGYVHQVNVHLGRGHNFLDNHPTSAKQSVLAKPNQWLKDDTVRSAKKVNSNAINWLDQYVRKPLPKRVIWDLKTRAERSADELWSSNARGRQSYWLADDALSNEELIAKFSKKRNRFTVEKATESFRILLSSKMVDFSKKIKVTIDGQKLSIKVTPTVKHSMQSLLDRGDKSYLFEASIQLEKAEDLWTVKAL